MAEIERNGTGGITVSVDEPFRKLCAHYSRGCSFVSPCCGKVYPCRLCHNDKELSHQIDRYAISQLICRKCNTQQPVGKECTQCGLLFGQYFCAVCRLYDDTDKGQFHCEKCGLCRVGGSENFFHCDTCGFCLATSMRETHACRLQASKNNCPVCMEDIHTSTDPAHVPQCGHLIHTPCYRQLLKNGLYQCPQCQTSLADMNVRWQIMDEERDAWEMPQHLKDFKVQVNCRDCHKQGKTLFHVIGLKCSSCGSYNTVRSGNEEVPEDPNPAVGLLNIIRQRMRRRAREHQDQEHSQEEETDSESDHEEDQDHSDEDGEDNLGNQNTHQAGDNYDNEQQEGEDPGNHDNEEDHESYDGDASEGNDESEDDPYSDSNDSEDSEPRRPQSYMFHTGNHTFFMSPIEVPAGNEPGGLQWWSDGNGSDDGSETHRTRRHHHHNRHNNEQNDDTHGRMVVQQFQRNSQLFGPENESEDSNETDNSKDEQRRTIAGQNVGNIWGSESDSFSEMSSKGCSSAASWVTEGEEVFIDYTKEDMEGDTDEWFEPSENTMDSHHTAICNGHETIAHSKASNGTISSPVRVFTMSIENCTSSEEGWETANEEVSVTCSD